MPTQTNARTDNFVAAPARSTLRRLYQDEPAFTAAGLLFLVLCAPTLLSLFLDPRQFQGDSIWLKPLKFELSLSLYLLTLAYLSRYLPVRLVRKRGYRIYAGVVVAATALEILWIGAAAAMGTASHFNVSTPLWQLVYAFMGVSAVTLTTASLVYGVCIWRQHQTELSEPLHIAISSGLILTFFMTILIASTLSSGTGHLVGVPESGGRLPILGWSTEVGDLRAPHFLATHAMQIIPLMTLASSTRRNSIAWLLASVYTLITLVIFLVSLKGLPIVPLG